MRSFAVAVAVALAVVACAAPPKAQLFAGTLPDGTELDLAGTFALSPAGELRLALNRPCMETRVSIDGPAGRPRCDREELDRIRVVARTPWGQDVVGSWDGPALIAFRIDWTATGVDPLGDDTPAMLSRVWLISGTQWTPTADEAAALLKHLGDATGTETELVRGGAAPRLEVAALEVDGGSLHLGEPATLVVRIINRGAGTAYRVVATTRSSIEALHSKRLSFGAIGPGADKVRKLQVTLPASETAHDTMLVLVVSEGNDAAPSNASRRIPIEASTAAPTLALRCAILGYQAPRPFVDAGQNLTVRCEVENTGNAEAREVSLDAAIGDAAQAHSPPHAVPAAGHATIDVAIAVPRGLPIHAPVEIAITARDRASSRSARATVAGVVRKPRLCEPGKLTRAQYQAKITELRAAVTAGDLTQAQFDRYDAELVACLK
jgi:hypothetical protein